MSLGNGRIVNWLMEGDPSIRWQVMRDLLHRPAREWESDRRSVATSGWGARLLSHQDPSGTWGGGMYSPKWISTTYTLLQLRHLGLPETNAAAKQGASLLVDEQVGPLGSQRFWERLSVMDQCVVGMTLSIGAYFGIHDDRLEAMAQHLLENQMSDGGWNCRLGRDDHVVHSSFHTTFNVGEGLQDYAEYCPEEANGRLIARSQAQAAEFMLAHKLFRSDRTGEIVHSKLLLFSYPPRWYYDVLRGLDFFQRIRSAYDPRFQEAIDLLKKKQRKDGTWPVQNKHPGKTFFEMEKTGQPSRWNTLRALRVLRWWDELTANAPSRRSPQKSGDPLKGGK